MAIYHFSGTVISRSQGRSAIACAAYRSGELLHDDRQDKTFDYSKKSDVAYTEILLPDHAPAWMGDREKLWNAVEASEKRKDSQLAREFNFALPRELTTEQNIALAKEFVQNEFVKHGMIADLAIHVDKAKDGEVQPHAHVMLTMREVTAEGFGQKVREWNGKDQLLLWREAWAETVNRHLFLHGHDITVDHRSLDTQGIPLEPQHKIGASVVQDHFARLEDHQRIARENGERLLQDPQVALMAITHQQSTFTHQDIARFVHRHTVDEAQFQVVYEKVKGSEEVVYLGLDDRQRERFTTKEMLKIESSMLNRAVDLSHQDGHFVSSLIQDRASQSRSLSVEQKIAFDHVVSKGALKSIVGYAGSGKSYLLGAAREAWEQQGYQVHGAALSGIAAENLEAGSGIESRTLASRFYYWDKGEQRLTDKDIVVVDEAGMIGSRQLNRLLGEVKQAKAKVVLVGDPYQLQAIEAGAAFRAINERVSSVTLSEIRRQRVEWQCQATVELALGKTAEAIARYDAKDNVHAFETTAAAKQGLVGLWNDVRLNDPDKTQIMLSYTRQDVFDLNQMARGLRKAQGELGSDSVLSTERGERAFAALDRIYFLKNDRELGVKNGTLGTIERIQGNLLIVRLDDGSLSTEKGDKASRTITFSTDRYNQLDHGYAATIHKAQGVTVDRSYLLASKYMDGHATYVGLSRHRDGADLFYSREEFSTHRDLSQTLGRERSKDVSLDYGGTDSAGDKTFADQRGIDHSKSASVAQKNSPEDHYEKFLSDTLRDMKPHEDRNFTAHVRKDFSDFTAHFEAQNPEQSKALKEKISAAEKTVDASFSKNRRVDVAEKNQDQSKVRERERGGREI